MLQISEISTDRLVRILRALVDDLATDASPFNKDKKYLNDVAGWVAAAATRIEQLQPRDTPTPAPEEKE